MEAKLSNEIKGPLNTRLRKPQDVDLIGHVHNDTERGGRSRPAGTLWPVLGLTTASIGVRHEDIGTRDTVFVLIGSRAAGERPRAYSRECRPSTTARHETSPGDARRDNQPVKRNKCKNKGQPGGNNVAHRPTWSRTWSRPGSRPPGRKEARPGSHLASKSEGQPDAGTRPKRRKAARPQQTSQRLGKGSREAATSNRQAPRAARARTWSRDHARLGMEEGNGTRRRVDQRSDDEREAGTWSARRQPTLAGTWPKRPGNTWSKEAGARRHHSDEPTLAHSRRAPATKKKERRDRL